MNEQAIVNKRDKSWYKIIQSDEFGAFIPLLLIIIITTIFRPDFFSVGNLSSIIAQLTFMALTALGASLPLMIGKVDISTGRTAGLAGIIMASLVADYGMNIWLAILVGEMCSFLVGCINAILVVDIGINDFVATMGTLYIFGGARYLLVKGYQFSLTDNFLVKVFDKHYLGMPIYFWIMIAIYIIAFIINKKTMWGRKLLAVGDNAEVAILAGINVKKMRREAYIICSMLAGLAGILLTLDIGIGLPENGDGWEFRAIAGAVVGGVSLSGGKGSPLGVFIGISLIFLAEHALIFLGVTSTMKIAVQGILMAGAVLFDTYRTNKKVQP